MAEGLGFLTGGDLKAYIDQAVSAAFAKAQTVQSVLANHGWSANSANVAVLTSPTLLATVTGIASKGAGKYRLQGMVQFTNSSAATHALTLQFNGAATSTASQGPLFSGASQTLISGGDNGFVGIQYETSAGGVLASATTGAVTLNGAADVATAISVLAEGATLIVQEVF